MGESPVRSVVTGGAGFIGSHVVDALLDRGEEVLVLDDLSSGRRENLAAALPRGAVLSEGSVTEPRFVEDQISQFGAQRIFHLAAQADVRKAVADPRGDASVNVLGTINVLEAARGCGAAVVLASTGGAIYGESVRRNLPLKESDDLAPETPYGVSKLAAEQYLDLYRRLHSTMGVALRFANVYGPRQDPSGEAGVVAIFGGKLRAGLPLTVFGDGQQTRDYVFVADVVAAVLAASEALVARGVGLEGPFNVGTGVETSVIELANWLGEAAGIKPELDHLPARTGEVQRIAIDPGAANDAIGWMPSVELSDGLLRTYRAL